MRPPLVPSWPLATPPRPTTRLSSSLVGPPYQPSRCPIRYPPLIPSLPLRAACPAPMAVSSRTLVVSPRRSRRSRHSSGPGCRSHHPVPSLVYPARRLAGPAPHLARCLSRSGRRSQRPAPPRRLSILPACPTVPASGCAAPLSGPAAGWSCRPGRQPSRTASSHPPAAHPTLAACHTAQHHRSSVPPAGPTASASGGTAPLSGSAAARSCPPCRQLSRTALSRPTRLLSSLSRQSYLPTRCLSIPPNDGSSTTARGRPGRDVASTATGAGRGAAPKTGTADRRGTRPGTNADRHGTRRGANGNRRGTIPPAAPRTVASAASAARPRHRKEQAWTPRSQRAGARRQQRPRDEGTSA